MSTKHSVQPDGPPCNNIRVGRCSPASGTSGRSPRRRRPYSSHPWFCPWSCPTAPCTRPSLRQCRLWPGWQFDRIKKSPKFFKNNRPRFKLKRRPVWTASWVIHTASIQKGPNIALWLVCYWIASQEDTLWDGVEVDRLLHQFDELFRLGEPRGQRGQYGLLKDFIRVGILEERENSVQLENAQKGPVECSTVPFRISICVLAL